MRTALVVLGAVGCNRAPPWGAEGISPYPFGEAPWGGPSDDVCDGNIPFAPDDVVVDGFTWCGRPALYSIVPVDGPIYRSCADGLPGDEVGLLYAVFDGARARGYALEKLAARRELVNTWWGDDPVLVDY